MLSRCIKPLRLSRLEKKKFTKRSQQKLPGQKRRRLPREMQEGLARRLQKTAARGVQPSLNLSLVHFWLFYCPKILDRGIGARLGRERKGGWLKP
jgi:hypothetical protein